jgi:membrane associated rhomboid family serine protease
MFLPIGDTQVTRGYKPIFSYLFILLNILVFLLQLSTEGRLVCEFSTIPIDIIQGENYYTILSSMFMHGGWMHLIGNMLFLWIFADNIEAKIGSFYFVIFYLLGGAVSSFAHIYASTIGYEAGAISCFVCNTTQLCDENIVPNAAVIPSLGASGAISAVLGAYLVMFPKSKIKVFFFMVVFFRSFYIPAFIFLGLWFAQQLFSGLGSFNAVSTASDGVAWWAHIGGFVFGLIMGFFLKKGFYDGVSEDLNTEEV